MNVKDLAERALWTFAQSASALVAAAGLDWVDVGVWKAAGVAGVAAVLSMVKTVAKAKYEEGSDL